MTGKHYRGNIGLALTAALAMIPFLYTVLVYTFHVPMWRLHNGAGIAAIILLGILLLEGKSWKQCAVQVRWMLISAGVFFALTVIGQLLGYQSIRYYLSGLNNNGRFFIFFFACVLFMKAQWRDSIMKLWDVLFWVNFVLTLYQFFALDLGWDYLGGIFGTDPGCNAYTNVFFLAHTSFSVLRYINQQEKAWHCLLRCAAALLVAALAELKMYILEFGAILVLAVLLTKFSRRKILLIVCGVIGAVACIKLMTTIFPWWKDWFNLKSIWKTATSANGYTGGGGWNRLTAIPIAWTEHLLTWPQKLFGLGLGNCDFSAVAGWSSPFYEANIATNYYLFSSGLIMLETGLIGTVAYVGFFLVVFFAAGSLKRRGEGDMVYCQMTQILALMCLVLYIYNCTLRTEVGYMVYFVMAMAFAGAKKRT